MFTWLIVSLCIVCFRTEIVALKDKLKNLELENEESSWLNEEKKTLVG